MSCSAQDRNRTARDAWLSLHVIPATGRRSMRSRSEACGGGRNDANVAPELEDEVV
jgi:hypothetical protein